MAKKNYLGRYAAFLRRHLKIQKPMRVVFDCSNGTAGLILKKTFGGFKGIEAIYINDQPDGRFPAHDPNPLAPHALDQLSAAVKRRGLMLVLLLTLMAIGLFLSITPANLFLLI